MRLASRIAWRSLASRPSRSITSVLGIAVGVATVLSVIIVDHNTILTEELRRPSFSGKPDVELRPIETGARDAAVPEVLTKDADLREVLPVFFSRARLAKNGGAAADVELVGADPRAGQTFSAWRVAEGETLLSNDESFALVPRAIASALGVAPGDEISLQRALPPTQCKDGVQVAPREEGGAPQTFRIAGVVEDDGLGRRGAVIVPYARGLSLVAGGHVQPVFWAKLAAGAVYQDVRERLKASFVVDKPRSALVGERIDQRAFRKAITMTAALSLLLGLFVIYNAFSLSLVERVREIGLFSALGLTSAEIAGAVILEGVVLALVGAAAGLGLAFVVVRVMDAFGITTLGWGKPFEVLDVPWSLVSIVLAAGALAAVLGVVSPLLRVRRISVIDAVRAGQIAYRPDPYRFARALVLGALPGVLLLLYYASTPSLGERQDEVLKIVLETAGWITLVFGLVLLVPAIVQRAVLGGVRVLLSRKPELLPVAVASTRGSHHRVFGSTVGIALVLAAVLAIRGITESLKDEMLRFTDRATAGRIFLKTRPLEKADVAKAAQAEGVAAFVPLTAEVLAPFPIRGVDPDAAVRAIPELADSSARAADFRAGRSIVLSEFLAASYGWVAGDEVRLSARGGALAVRVACVTDVFGYFPDDRSFAVLAMPTFKNAFCLDDASGTNWVFHVKDGDDANVTRGRILSWLAPRDVQTARTAREVRQDYLADMNRDFWIFRVVLAMTTLLAFVGLWNSLTVALLERRREIGLLRALGVTAGEVGSMLAAESIALGLVGGILALIAGAPVSSLLVDAIRVISRLDVRPVTPLLDAILVPIVAAFLALLATVPPALRVKSLVIASATRME